MAFNYFFGTFFVVSTLLFLDYRYTNHNQILPKPLIEAMSEPNGSQIYTRNCVRCHNADPSKKGTIGPEIANSNFELLQSKTQFRTYPLGYTPKRKTKIMPRIPLSDEQIRALEGFLKRSI